MFTREAYKVSYQYDNVNTNSIRYLVILGLNLPLRGTLDPVPCRYLFIHATTNPNDLYFVVFGLLLGTCRKNKHSSKKWY